jgi:hypothetical protein
MKSGSKLYCKSLWTSIVTVILIISVMTPLMVQAVIYSTGTYFEVIPASIYKTSGSIQVEINVANAPAHVYGWQLDLYYNPAVLTFVSAINGSFIPGEYNGIASSFGYTPASTANAQGYVEIAMAYTGSSPGSGPGNGWLCNATFTVSSGSSNLHLQNTELLSTSLVKTSYPANDGFFSNAQPVHDIGITNVVANATWPLANVTQGTPVGINVTIHNAGSYSSAENFWVNVTAHPTDPREPVVSIGNKSSSLASGGSITLTFTWNTATVDGQIYLIWSNATIIGFTDQNLNNNLYIGPTVRVVCPHNIKVAGVTVLGTVWNGYPTVHKGQNATVSVTAANEGQNLETFTVKVWANSGSGYSSVASVVFASVLPNNNNSTETATWNTTGMTPGLYTIMANATLSPEYEKDTADNQITATSKLNVIIDDLGILSVATQGYGMWVNVTVKNYGTVSAYFTVYVWAVPCTASNRSLSNSLFNTSWTMPAYKPPEPGALLVGEMEGLYLLAGTNETFTNLDPYLRMPYGQFEPTLWLGTGIAYVPNTEPVVYLGAPLTPKATYAIWAVLVKIPSYPGDVDDNPANNWFMATGLSKARIAGDITAAGTVGARDMGILGAAYNSYPLSSNYNFECDFTDAAYVGALDMGKVGANYNLYY